MKTILYIAGYGRSGSTLLERVLSSHERVYATGELSCLAELVGGPSPRNSGGKYRLQDARFWERVINKVRKECSESSMVPRSQHQIDSWRGFSTYAGFRPEKAQRVYRDYVAAVLGGIDEQVPESVRYLVDSSKTARRACFRPIAFRRLCGINVKVLHLVRDGRGCVWSYLRGSNYKLAEGDEEQRSFPALRASLGWMFANAAAEALRWELGQENYCRIRYEDFVQSPRETLLRIGSFLNLDYSTVAEQLENGRNIQTANQIAGNRSKDERIVLEIDDEWRTELPLRYRMLFGALGWPLALKYDYF